MYSHSIPCFLLGSSVLPIPACTFGTHARVSVSAKSQTPSDTTLSSSQKSSWHADTDSSLLEESSHCCGPHVLSSCPAVPPALGEPVSAPQRPWRMKMANTPCLSCSSTRSMSSGTSMSPCPRLSHTAAAKTKNKFMLLIYISLKIMKSQDANCTGVENDPASCMECNGPTE